MSYFLFIRLLQYVLLLTSLLVFSLSTGKIFLISVLQSDCLSFKLWLIYTRLAVILCSDGFFFQLFLFT